MRTCFLALALLAACSGALAGEAKPKSQFLDKSQVIFPRSADKYTLLDTDYDAAMFQTGVTSTWSVEGAPEELRLNVFVYPQGRGREADVVAQEMEVIEASVREAEKQGLYSEVAAGERQPFVVAAPESSWSKKDGKAPAPFDPTPKPEPVPGAKPEGVADNDPALASVARHQRSPNTHGMRQSFSFRRKDGVVARSMAYAFYRNLFNFKLRISVPEAQMDQAAFEAAADAAARNLVPRIEVRNFGECGTITVPSQDPKGGKKEGADALMDAMIGGMIRMQAENCGGPDSKSATEPEAPNTRRVEIVYPEGTWKQD
jgi:hypothetical protein